MTYEEIFELDGRWVMGRFIFSDIVKYVKGKSLVAAHDADYIPKLRTNVPLPMIRDEVTREFWSMAYLVPPEVRDKFITQLNHASTDYLGEEGRQLLDSFSAMPITQHTIREINDRLFQFERRRADAGDGELWKFVGIHLGVDPYASLDEKSILLYQGA